MDKEAAGVDWTVKAKVFALFACSTVHLWNDSHFISPFFQDLYLFLAQKPSVTLWPANSHKFQFFILMQLIIAFACFQFLFAVCWTNTKSQSRVGSEPCPSLHCSSSTPAHGHRSCSGRATLCSSSTILYPSLLFHEAPFPITCSKQLHMIPPTLLIDACIRLLLQKSPCSAPVKLITCSQYKYVKCLRRHCH